MRLPESVSVALLAALGVLVIVGLAAAWPLPIRAAAPQNADPEPNMGQGECITVDQVVRSAGEVATRNRWLATYSIEAVGIRAKIRITILGESGALEFYFLDGCMIGDKIVE